MFDQDDYGVFGTCTCFIVESFVSGRFEVSEDFYVKKNLTHFEGNLPLFAVQFLLDYLLKLTVARFITILL